MRERLLLRIHQAYLRQARNSPTKSSDGVDFFSCKILGEMKRVEDPGHIMMAMNASMTLALARTMQTSSKLSPS
jgi:hypothetical protein